MSFMTVRSAREGREVSVGLVVALGHGLSDPGRCVGCAFLEVLVGHAQQLRTLPKEAQARVACGADQPADVPGDMVVVDAQGRV
ncbi:MAG: hypothetical protein QOF51_2929 [Chloroflexota bacterium]|nr:hypothetical protein [Chloroflexota bacterium]